MFKYTFQVEEVKKEVEVQPAVEQPTPAFIEVMRLEREKEEMRLKSEAARMAAQKREEARYTFAKCLNKVLHANQSIN